jgi:hypothetical protein
VLVRTGMCMCKLNLIRINSYYRHLLTTSAKSARSRMHLTIPCTQITDSHFLNPIFIAYNLRASYCIFTSNFCFVCFDFHSGDQDVAAAVSITCKNTHHPSSSPGPSHLRGSSHELLAIMGPFRLWTHLPFLLLPYFHTGCNQSQPHGVV